MLEHHLLLIYRNFKRFKSSFFINLIGLSTGLACTLLIYLWVDDEFKVDKFHANDSRLYKLMEYQQNATNNVRVTDSTPGLLAEELEGNIPEVEYSRVVTPSIGSTNRRSLLATNELRRVVFMREKVFLTSSRSA